MLLANRTGVPNAELTRTEGEREAKNAVGSKLINVEFRREGKEEKIERKEKEGKIERKRKKEGKNKRKERKEKDQENRKEKELYVHAQVNCRGNDERKIKPLRGTQTTGDRGEILLGDRLIDKRPRRGFSNCTKEDNSIYNRGIISRVIFSSEALREQSRPVVLNALRIRTHTRGRIRG